MMLLKDFRRRAIRHDHLAIRGPEGFEIGSEVAGLIRAEFVTPDRKKISFTTADRSA